MPPEREVSTVQAMQLRGQALLDARRPAEAVEVLRRAVAADPADAQSLCLLSLAHLRAEDPWQALAVANDAAAAAPTSVWAQRLRCSALIKLRMPDGALAAAHQAVTLAPYAADSYLMLGEAHLAAGNLHEAGLAADRARSLAPHQTAPHVLASVVALRGHRWSEAEGHARAALAADPENTAALNNLGVALRGLGKRREAVHYMGTASRLDPSNPLYRRNAVHTATGYIGTAIVAVLWFAWVLAGGGNVLGSAAAAAVVLLVFGLITRREALWRTPLARLRRNRNEEPSDPRASPELMAELRRSGLRLPSRAEREAARGRRQAVVLTPQEERTRRIVGVLFGLVGLAFLVFAGVHSASPTWGDRLSSLVVALGALAVCAMAFRSVRHRPRRTPPA
jgi:tetratricopeptide (TPR) repeat protein